MNAFEQWVANALVTISGQVHYNSLKLNKILEKSGEDEEIRQLTKQLHKPIKKLSSAVKQQTKTKGKRPKP
jgi:hypothetical protein